MATSTNGPVCGDLQPPVMGRDGRRNLEVGLMHEALFCRDRAEKASLAVGSSRMSWAMVSVRSRYIRGSFLPSAGEPPPEENKSIL